MRLAAQERSGYSPRKFAKASEGQKHLFEQVVQRRDADGALNPAVDLVFVRARQEAVSELFRGNHPARFKDGNDCARLTLGAAFCAPLFQARLETLGNVTFREVALLDVVWDGHLFLKGAPVYGV